MTRIIGSDLDDEIEGFAGHDILIGNAGHDDIDGSTGNDSVAGGSGNDDLDGEAGNDRLDGGDGDDTVDGGRGDDILTGGSGSDRFEFDRGDGRDTITDFRNGEDRLDLDDFSADQVRAVIDEARQIGSDVVLSLSVGTSVTLQNFSLADLDLSDFADIALPPPPTKPVRGRDIDGTKGADVLRGGDGNDDIEGNAGNDLLEGLNGNDEIDGDKGSDTLSGGEGRDDLDGGRGRDILTGGAGADRFEFERGDGRDRITDFRNGEDRIDLDDYSFAAIQSLISGAQQVGSDVVLNLSAGNSITVAELRLSQLDMSDFIL